MKTKQNILTFKINTQEPIGVIELAESLKAMGELYFQSVGGKSEIKISEVRKGSYEFDLIVAVLPLIMEHINVAAEFIKNIDDIIRFISDFLKKDTKEINLNKPTITQIKNVNKIIQPIINIAGDNNTISIHSNDDNEQQNFTINQEQAKKFKKNSELYIEQITENNESIETFINETLEFTQTRDDSKKGTKAICKNFSEKEINVEFANNLVRDSVFKEDDNPHLFSFVVDLEIEFKNKQPNLYKIIAIKDKKVKSQDQRLPLE